MKHPALKSWLARAKRLVFCFAYESYFAYSTNEAVMKLIEKLARGIDCSIARVPEPQQIAPNQGGKSLQELLDGEGWKRGKTSMDRHRVNQKHLEKTTFCIAYRVILTVNISFVSSFLRCFP